MAEFEVKVVRIDSVEAHPNADRLDLAAIGGYRSIVGKEQFTAGDLVAYIPEASVCPDWLIAEMGLEGRLAGKAKNRVKAIRLRGVLSQGLVYPLGDGLINGQPVDMAEGSDIADLLGIVKYEPKIPAHMNGRVQGAHGMTLKFDIENIKKHPDVFVETDRVVHTEKVHGTWCCFGWHPDAPGNGWIVTSKGLSARGLIFQLGVHNDNNLYVRMFRKLKSELEALDKLIKGARGMKPWYLLGEIYGAGVQDLRYNAVSPAFRVFDLYIGPPDDGFFIHADHLGAYVNMFDRVPELYRGVFSMERVLADAIGQTTIGDAVHVREGIVVRPLRERYNISIGRLILKAINDEYLMRKGGTELE